MMVITKNFADIKATFAEDLSKVTNIIATSLASRERLVEDISAYLMQAGGKRIRPILTLLFSKICSYEGRKHIFLAAAVEMIHAATLLHDDVVDESMTRRNKPTANFEWGNKASILVGDFLFSQAFKLMVRSESMDALKSLSDASAIIAEGEVMQLAALSQNRIISVFDYEEIANAKTAALFGASAHVGAIIAGRDEAMAEACKKFGNLLGLIFQISDDMLDYFGDPAVSGKSLGDDLTQGSVTIPIILAYDRASAEDKIEIAEIFRADNRALKFDRIKSLLIKYDTEAAIETYIESFAKEAREIINILPYSAELTPYLHLILECAAYRSV